MRARFVRPEAGFVRMMCRAVVAVGAMCAACAAEVNFHFEDVSTRFGIQPFTMSPGLGAGCAAADFDDDGFIDLFVPNDFGPDQLYSNLGDGSFEEIGVKAGVGCNDPNKVPLWFDYDGDGRLDLLVTGGDSHTDQAQVERTVRLYWQSSPGQFVDVTDACGLAVPALNMPSVHVGGQCVGDINNDGSLDLVISVYFGPVHLFLNNRDGTFTDIAAASGIADTDFYWQPMMHDFDQDGWLDLYLNVEFAENRLWLNQHDNTFINAAAASGLAADFNEMGMAFGDYDNDGDLDLYLTNTFDYIGAGEHNILYKNNSVAAALSYQDVAIQAKVGNGGWGWGCTFIDGDNDGRADIATTNGYSYGAWLTDTSKFFRNKGGSPVTFENASAAADFDDSYWGSGLVAFDHDRDGDQDLVQVCAQGGPLRLLDNVRTGPALEHNHLVIQPRMRSGGNRFAIGAEVKIEAVGGLKQARLITAGNSFFSQEPAEAFFGLGAHTAANVLVLYPDGTRMAFVNLPGNQIVEVVLGDLNAGGIVNGLDLAMLLGNWGPCAAESIYCPGDFNGDNVVNGLDLAMLLANWG